MHGSSGCLGCETRRPLVSSADKSSKGLGIKAQTVYNPSASEDFWTTSACEMDNSAVQSQGSISSISTSVQTLDPHGGSGPVAGLILWNQSRQHWIGNKRTEIRAKHVLESQSNTHCLSMVKQFWLCSWNATYDSLLASNKPFPQPIPLSEMVDFLVDVWEQEGMYD